MPAEYFPMTLGTKWIYKIDVGPAEPLYFEEVSWPLGNKHAVYATRGRYFRAAGDEKRTSFSLEMKIKQPATKQGPLEYPRGVELEILKDELGIFGEARQLYWAVANSGRYMAHLVVMHSPEEPGAPTGPWGHWGSEDGYSVRLLFFGERPGVQIGLGKDPMDKLLLEGVVQHPSFSTRGPLLHFRRSVEPNTKIKESPGYLDSGFTEDVWFAKGKGLIRLEQKVEGKTSMVWTLVEN